MINDTELDEAPTSETESDVNVDTGTDTASDDAAESGESETPANQWDGMPSLSELLEKDSSQSKDSSERDAAEGEDTVSDVEDDEEEDSEESEARTDEEGDEDSDTDADAEDGESSVTRYTIQDAQGHRFEFQLDEGTSISFDADGETVTLSSMDDLIDMARKGATVSARESEWTGRASELTTKLTDLEATLTQERGEAEELLLKALFDRGARDELRKALAPFRDPEFRKGQEAIAREAERVEREKATTEHSAEQNQKQFWTSVGKHIKTALPEFDLLEETDARAIAERFYAGYIDSFTAALTDAERRGLTGAAREQDAQQRAFAYLTEKNVRRAMRTLNEDMKARLTKRGIAVPKKAEKKPSTVDAHKAADTHNTHVKNKLEQRRRSPKRLEKGADPASGVRLTKEQQQPKTYDQKMERAKALLRSAGKPGGGGDDDE